MTAALAALDDDLAVARSVLATEAAGLRALAAALDQRFAAAVALLAGLPGRVVVTGIGKSGHVARKIAATLASTGTPSLFVHPAEASHGDLGMVLAGDGVLALSNSGETAELADLVAHARRFGLPLVAITGQRESTLARAADVALVLPQAPEACAVTGAPTTSTTMQMALGDAVAVALLQRRGFTAGEFRTFHPGGRLGARLQRVGALMHVGEAMPLAPLGTAMPEAIVLMTTKSLGCLGVLDAQGRLAGIITDGDLRRAMGPGLLERRVEQVMTEAPGTIGPDALAAEALHRMTARARPITSLFVVDAAPGGGRPVGLLHLHDLLRAGLA
jgi:arabinose-5-phosphate isomerase